MISILDNSVSVDDLLEEVNDNEDCWTLNVGRQQTIRCQRDTQTIFLRSLKRPVPKGMNSDDVHASRLTKVSARFPRVMCWLDELVKQIGGKLGRVMIVRIKPQGSVYRHRDGGDYYQVRNRFHLMLTAPGGCTLSCGAETAALRPGQLLWFDNKEHYEERNPCDSWSIRIVFDVLPPVAPPAGSPHKHFALIRSGIDISPIALELRQQPDLWDMDTSRRTNVRVQRETSNIHLRSAAKPRPDGISLDDWHPSRKTNVAARCPATCRFVESVASDLRGRLSRLTVVRLNPYGRVYPHIDEGEYYRIRDRYHLVIKSTGGSEMLSGGERVVFNEGELWWFDNKAFHEAFNNSKEGRVHVIFDLLPAKPRPPSDG